MMGAPSLGLLAARLRLAESQGRFSEIAPLCGEVRIAADLTTDGTGPLSIVSSLFSVVANDSAPVQTKEAAAEALAPALKAARGHVTLTVTRDVLISTPLLILYGCIPPNPNSAPANAVVSDELKTAAIKALGVVLADPNPSTHPDAKLLSNQLRDFRFVPLYGQAISTILDTLNPTTDKQLHIASLETLGLIVNLLSPENTAKVLPGLVSNLVVFIEKRSVDKIGSNVMVKALDLLSLVICNGLTDGPWFEVVQASLSKAKDNDSAPEQASTNAPILPQSEIRNLQWYTNTCTRIAQVTKKLLSPLRKPQCHQNYKVRLSYVQFSSSLLQKCRITLGRDDSIAMTLLQCISGFMQDETEEVRIECSSSVESILNHPPFSSLMLKDLSRLMRHDIPNALVGADWGLKSDLLRLCGGYLTALGRWSEDLKEFQFTNEIVNEFLRAVLKNVAFEHSNIKLIEDRDIGKSSLAINNSEQEITAVGSLVTKYLDSNQTQDVLTGVSRVLKFLAEFGNSDQIFAMLVSLFEETDSDKSVIIFLMNEFSSGLPHKDSIVPMAILQSLIMVYLSSPILPAPTTRRQLSLIQSPTPQSDDTKSKTIIKTINQNVVSTCLLLDGISTASRYLGPRGEFSPFLIDVLYPVIEKIGDTNRMVSETAAGTLQIMAQSCGTTVQTLIVQNIDYIVNDLSLRLRYLGEYPNAPNVLVAVLGVAGTDVVPYLDDVFEDVLMAIDFRQSEYALLESVFGALETLVGVIGGSTKNIGGLVMEAAKEESAFDGVSKAMKEFEDLYHEKMKRRKEWDAMEKNIPPREPGVPFSFSKKEGAEEKEPTDEELMQEVDKEEEREQEDGKPKLTSSEQMAQKILTKAQHFLTRDDPHLQTLVLRLSTKSVLLLKDKPNTMNPLAHVLWPTIIRLLGSTSQHYVILEALNLISSFATVSRDFLLRRFLQDLLPKLEHVLKTFSFTPSGDAKKRGTIIKQTGTLRDPHNVVFKIVVKAMETLSGIVNSIPVIQVPELIRITDCVWGFLASDQHEKVQDASKKVLAAVAKKDANDIWMRIQVGKGSIKPPVDGLGLEEVVFPHYLRDQASLVFIRDVECIEKLCGLCS
ncbi:TEL2-interacting protein 1 [Rhizoclosmatium sp. JEL0117]|nr:TEL2-interacting protein 1 [Rhizoclosmatium sp. JEL0117]